MMYRSVQDTHTADTACKFCPGPSVQRSCSKRGLGPLAKHLDLGSERWPRVHLSDPGAEKQLYHAVICIPCVFFAPRCRLCHLPLPYPAAEIRPNHATLVFFCATRCHLSEPCHVSHPDLECALYQNATYLPRIFFTAVEKGCEGDALPFSRHAQACVALGDVLIFVLPP